jgi:hypothetical protein
MKRKKKGLFKKSGTFALNGFGGTFSYSPAPLVAAKISVNYMFTQRTGLIIASEKSKKMENEDAGALASQRGAAAVDGAAFSPFVEHSNQRDKLGNELSEIFRLPAALVHDFQQRVHLDDFFSLSVASGRAQFAFESPYLISHFIQRVENAPASHVRGDFSLGVEVEGVQFLGHVESQHLKLFAQRRDFIVAAHARPPANAV